MIIKRIVFEAKIKDIISFWKKDIDSYEVNSYIEKFNSLKNNHILSPNEKDISKWYKLPFKDFKKFCDAKLNEYKRKRKLKGIMSSNDELEKVFQNEKVTVYEPLTKEAMCTVGRDTDWCISKPLRKEYEKMVESGAEMYVIVKNIKSDDNLDKVCFTKYAEGDIDIWDKYNDPLPSDDAREQFFIDNNLEEFAIEFIDDWYIYFENFDDDYYK